MMLLPDWKLVIKKAWSVKFMALVVVVAGCETVVQYAGIPFLPSWVVPSVTGLLAAFGIFARVLAQKEAEVLAGGKDDPAQ